MRLFRCREVDDGFIIEHHDVGEHTLAQETAVAQSESRRYRAAHLAYSLLESEELLLANVPTENARIAAVRSWMDNDLRAVGIVAARVSADDDPGLLDL